MPSLTQFADLVALLRQTNVPHKAFAASQTLEIPVASPPLTGTIGVRWDLNMPYVQIVLPFVEHVPEERVADVETAICRANTLIALPGLGFQYDKHFVFMRRALVIDADGLPSVTFQRQLLGVVQLARDFIGPFREVIGGHPGADIIGLAVKHKVDFDAASHPMPKA
jgi:hypothetical protein